MATVIVVPQTLSSVNTGWIDNGTPTPAKVNTDDEASSFIYSPTNTSIVTYLMSAHGI
ncbi:hypothetical protein VF34_01816 [Rhodococcus sp. PML026]|jgi:hypothetical protein|nr:hypothetical protein VF34_01816 [Rhodococcus sp. PML026]